MIAGRPRDYREVVHPRRNDTAVYLLAQAPPCLRLRDDAAKPTGRDYRTARLGDLSDLKPHGSFVVAAILCPGDTAKALVDWMTTGRVDPDRLLFILHPDTDAVAALKAWYDADHPDPVVLEARSWRELAKPLGMFVNDRIYTDAQGTGWNL